MQLGTRLSIASIRLVLCAAAIAGGSGGRVSAQQASSTSASARATVDDEVPPPVVTAPAASPVATPAAAAPAKADEDGRPWALLHRAYNTWDGSTGGLYAEDPGMGMPGAVRLQLGLGLYSGEDFFYEGDQVEQSSQSFTLSVTALEFLELFAGLQNRGTTTTIPTDPPRTSALHAFADVGFGAKLGWSASPVVRLGGGVRFALRSDVGPEEAMLDSTSIGLKLDAAFDLQRMRSPWPLIIRLNVDYFFDNSASVIEDIEDQRYESLPSPMVKDNEVAHLVTRVERYGLNVNRVDLLTPLIGFELPLELTEDFSLHPLVEYRIGFPIARGGYDCPFFSGEDDRGSNEPGADDTCLDDVGVEAWPMTLALGARLVPPVRGVSFLLGVDIGLSGTSTFVRELAPTAPFKAMLAFSYDYDARPVEPVVVTVAPPAPPPPAPAPAAGRVHGTIVDARTQAALQGVMVAIARSEFTPVATNIAGRFSTYELPPGEVTLELTHPEYHPSTCSGVIPEGGGEVNVACSMNELPTAGTLTASVNDAFGGPLAGARVLVSGTSSATGATDADGEARIADLPAGEYQARVEAEGYLTRGARFTVQKRATSSLQVALVARPAKASVAVRGTTVTAKALKFQPGTTVLAPGGSIALAELADYLLRNPASRLRVQCDGDEGLALTRALVIKQGLLDLGASEAQVDAVAEPAKAITLTLVQ